MSKVVSISKSTSEIKYDDEVNMWYADIIFNVYDKNILIYGTTRKLTDKERSDIITELLNKYYFRKLLKS